MSANWSLDGVDLVELDRLAQRLALVLKPGDLIAVSGPLGAGKTSFARALLMRLGVATNAAASSSGRIGLAR
jgi:tRNA A37 threonylcarbamoyladenosine biosynthesis protein TsaE